MTTSVILKTCIFLENINVLWNQERNCQVTVLNGYVFINRWRQCSISFADVAQNVIVDTLYENTSIIITIIKHGMTLNIIFNDKLSCIFM